jgi:hypothetical protein
MTEQDWMVTRHEAEHACAALCQGIPVAEVRPLAFRPGEHLGYMNFGLQALVEGIDKTKARKTAIILLAGPGMADQPLPSWPLSRKNRGDDEHLLAALCEYLGINEASYAGLCGEMWSLTTTRKFELLFTAITTWLKRAPRLDRAMIAQAQTIAWR